MIHQKFQLSVVQHFLSLMNLKHFILLATDSSGVQIALRLQYPIQFIIWRQYVWGSFLLIKACCNLMSSYLFAEFYKSGHLTFCPTIHQLLTTTRYTLRSRYLLHNPDFKHFIYNWSLILHKCDGFVDTWSMDPSF